MKWQPNLRLYPPYLRTRIRRRRGIGQGRTYVPWLKARDVPSRGTSSIVKGIHDGRAHHMLSELEAIYFFLMERRASTVEIREQWPILDIDRTLELCAKLGVSHGFRKGFPEPFTIDFLITERINGELKYRAASIKSPKDARDPQVRQRLAVEHAWCREHGIPWTLVDTTSFDKTVLENLRFMRTWYRHRYVPDPSLESRFLRQFRAEYAPNILLKELISRLSKSLRQTRAVVGDMFRYCTWHNHIETSLFQPLTLNSPVVLRTAASHG